MEEIIFKPEYAWNLPKYLWLFPFHLLIFLPVMPLNASSLLWLAIFFIIFYILIIGIYMVMIKEICFSDRITIRRYFRRDQIAEYSDVQDVILTGFRVGGTYIYWYDRRLKMKNGDELERIVRGLIEKGIIDESQFEKMNLKGIFTLWAIGIGVATALTTGIAVLEAWPGFIPPGFFIALIYLVCFVIALVASIFVSKRKEAT